MATRSDLDALVVQVEGGLDLEENKAGSGAYGCVFRVTVNGRDCIAKKLHHILLQERYLGQRERIVTMFQNECHILSVLDHPNIVAFVGVHYGRDKNDISLIMERLHNSDLANFVETHRDTNIATRIHILYDVSKGLHYLHSLTPPLIHRDLTAPNILLTEDLTAKIGDLGVSRYVDLERLTQIVLTSTPGNVGYMPPECRVERPTYTTKLDIFSFGHLIIHTVIGDFPKVNHVPQSIRNYFKSIGGKEELMRRSTDVHGDKMGQKHALYPLVVSCLHDRPQQRPSVDEVIVSLRKLCLQHPRMEFLDACKTGNVGVVLELLECGADPNQADKDVPLHWAINNGHDEIVRVLLAAKATVNTQTKSGVTPLWEASFNGHQKRMELLIDAGANVDVPREDGATALIVAAQNGHVRAVELLLAATTKVDIQAKNGATALYMASKEGHCGVVRMLLEAKTDVNIETNNNQTALHAASYNGHDEIVRVLLAAKATVNTQEKSGETPLWTASFYGHQKCMELLIDAGANVDVPNEDGATALIVAAQNGHVRAVELLIAAKAKVDIQYKNDGATALYMASQEGHCGVFRMLLEAKADVHIQNNDGRTAYDVASRNGHTQVCELLH
ncbi:ankyrin repeat and protein kinase domain-containing protein 1-like isoform X3 [Halichondria panicea]|uniref:ankyrin repeat and protein kinase domain-containing protein 1-like isoform X3 n=1 Tax=Halichondria panicea TaxID=6063 RepID=UPI00312BC0D1